MAFENSLLQYGSLGIFTLYLIYDRQVTIKKLELVLENNTNAVKNLSEIIKNKRR